MFIGPVFTREVTIAPRRDWTYILRTVYVGLLLLLIVTAWLVISGTQLITDPGDFARFGTMLFQFLAPVQLVLAIFFAATLAAGAVGQEKERGTLLLLLMTRMTNRELVLGKLLASLLNIITMLAVSIPVFMAIAMLGGVSYYQIARVLIVTLFCMLACGSLGSCVALWREKTFQAIATTILIMVLWIGFWESMSLTYVTGSVNYAAMFSPWSAILAASRPAIDVSAGLFGPIQGFLLVCGCLVIGINAIAIAMVRVWNPSREARTTTVEVDTWHKKQVEQTLEETLTFDSVSWEVGCRPPGGNVGDSRLEKSSSAEYRTQPPGGRLPTSVKTQTPARPPMAYFILPILLSFPSILILLSPVFYIVPLYIVPLYIVPLVPSAYPFTYAWALIAYTILAVGFIGMLFQQKWALWLTAIILTVLIGWFFGHKLLAHEPIPLDGYGYYVIFYNLLIAASCFFALWQCSRYEKKVGCRPPGGIVGDSRPKSRGCSATQSPDTSAEYRTQLPGGRLPTFAKTQKPARLPMAYFIVPILLSFPLVLYLFYPVFFTVHLEPSIFPFTYVWLIACIIFAVGFVGMIFRKKWTLWLTASFVIGGILGNRLSHAPIPLDAYGYGLIFYFLLLAASCFYALWLCSRFEKSSAAVCRLPSAVSTRHAWNNPIIWREIMTQAYGRRIWIIQFGFLAFFAMCFWSLHTLVTENVIITAAQLAGPLVPLFLLSLVLVNAQAITSQTSEKDGRTFDLILASDITPKEYVFGKLGGVFYNMKWIVLLPLALCVYLYWYEAITGGGFFFLLISLTVLYAFSAMVGVYIGMQYDNTRAATATSLGTIFFLFVGIAACIWIMVAFSGSFETQLVPFAAFMIGGGIGLYVTLGARNPSSAIATASFSLPIAVFYIITSMLLGKYMLVFVALCGAFGFTTAAMLIPSIAEFDVATGRTTAD